MEHSKSKMVSYIMLLFLTLKWTSSAEFNTSSSSESKSIFDAPPQAKESCGCFCRLVVLATAEVTNPLISNSIEELPVWIINESHVEGSNVIQTDGPGETLQKGVQFPSTFNDIFRYCLLNCSFNMIFKSIYKPSDK